MCVEFRIFGIPFVEVISDQKMNVSFETTLVYPPSMHLGFGMHEAYTSYPAGMIIDSH
jgi:hypothetical protein